MEHRDRLARFGVEQLEVARGRRIVVADPGGTIDDLVRGVTWVLASVRARLFRARNGALRAVTAGKRDPNSQTWAG